MSRTFKLTLMYGGQTFLPGGGGFRVGCLKAAFQYNDFAEYLHFQYSDSIHSPTESL